MKRILLMATLLFAAAGLLTLRAYGETKISSAPEPQQQKEQYEKSMEERLGNLGKQLDGLRAKARTKTDEARQGLDQFVKDAEKKQETAARKLGELRKASVKMWEKFKGDTNKAAEEFEQAYERAKQHFKE